MVKQSPRLDKKYKPQRSVIKDEATFSKMEARASDSKKLDGLNTHFAIFDEIHEFINFKLINVIKKSRGTRRQPLITYITTAGYVLDGPLMQYYDNALDCLEHLDDGLDERVFYFIAKLDDVSEADDRSIYSFSLSLTGRHAKREEVTGCYFKTTEFFGHESNLSIC